MESRGRHAAARADRPSQDDILRWLRLLIPGERTTELFVKEHKRHDYSKPVNVYGFFDNLELLAKHAYGLSGRCSGVYFSLNPLREELLLPNANRVHVAKRQQLAKRGDVVRRELLLVDIDPKRSALVSSTDEEKGLARAKAKLVYEFLQSRKWPLPVLVDSGNGFHLIYRVDLPADDNSLIRNLLKTLAAKFSDERVEIDTSVFDPIRLCKIPGTMACKGEDTAQRPHRYSRVLCAPNRFRCVSTSLLEYLADTPASSTNETEACEDVPQWLLRDARSYVEKMPEAIAGQHGHDALFAVACRLIIDFDLSPKTAFPILQDYNKRCQPPWNDRELKRKLEEANKVSGERGKCVRHRVRLASSKPVQTAHRDSDGFHGYVPDFAYLDARAVLVPIVDYVKIWRFEPIFWLSVWQQQTSKAMVPDVFLRQCWWGANFPRNWRRQIKTWRCLRTIEEKWPDLDFRCPPTCPLFGAGTRHKHFVRSHQYLYGVLERFTVATERNGHRRFDVFGDDEETCECRKERKRAGRLLAVYWPNLIFSDSPRVGITASQQRLLLAITRELTLDKRSPREDRAQVIPDRRVPVGRAGNEVTCPILDKDRAYVAFGGNGRAIHKGKGYYLNVWLDRAGHTIDFLGNRKWDWAERLFSDLTDLSDNLDLTVVGRHSARKEWSSLDEMQSMLKTGRGREILQDCRIRVFAPEDYLVLWRLWFSHRLGFDWIPRSRDDPWSGDNATESDHSPLIRNAEQVRRFLDGQGMTQGELAQMIGCSRERVSRHLNGRANSPQFFRDVSKLARPPETLET